MKVRYIGDIHGQLGLLDSLLNKISPGDDDLLVFLGDYVDRGPDVFGVIERLYQLQQSKVKTAFLMGNHEMVFFEYLGYAAPLEAQGALFAEHRKLHRAVERFVPHYGDPRVGGSATLQSYFGSDAPSIDRIPLHHRAFFESLVLTHCSPDKAVVAAHAGLSINEHCRTADEVIAASDCISDVLWSRNCARGPFEGAHWEFTLVLGHTAQPDGFVKRKGNIILADANAAAAVDLAAWSPSGEVVYANKSGTFQV